MVVFAVTVPDAPKVIAVPFTVTDEFCNAVFGKLRVELAATNGMPVGPVIKKPLVPIPQLVVVPNAVDITLPVTCMGYVPVYVVGAVPLEAAVIKPFALTVMFALVNDPTLPFTVAKVPAAVTFPEPSNVGDVYAKSPVIEMVRPVASAVAVPALPVILALSDEVDTAYKVPLLPPISPLSEATLIVLENISVPLKVLVSPSNVEDADVPELPVIVTGDEPNMLKAVHEAVPAQVTVVVGVFKRMPLGPVYTAPPVRLAMLTLPVASIAILEVPVSVLLPAPVKKAIDDAAVNPV